MASKISSHGLAPAPASSTELYYEQEGNPNGPAVLFVHGLGGTTNTFQPLVHALQDCNLVRFDFSGHGRSTLPKLTSIASYVDDCEGKQFFTTKSPRTALVTALTYKTPNPHQR